MRIAENNPITYLLNMESTGGNGNSSPVGAGNKRKCQHLQVDGGSGDDRIGVFSFPGGSASVRGGSGDDVINIGRYMGNNYDDSAENSGGAEPAEANDIWSGGSVHVNGGSGDDAIHTGHGHGNNHCGTETSGSSEPVAANETGKIWGDPHFVGGDGGKFDVQGEAGKTYNLLSDKGLQVNGRFDKFGNNDGITVVGQTGIKVNGAGGKTSEVGFSKDGTATINGQKMKEGQAYNLADGGTGTLAGKKLTTTTGEGYTIEQDAVGSGDHSYINMTAKTGKNGVDHGQMPGGLLGQTFDADSIARNGKTGSGAQGEGAIEGRVQDYEKNGLFDSRNSRLDNQNLGRWGHLDVNGGSGDDRMNVDGRGYGSGKIHGGSGDDVIVVGGNNGNNNGSTHANGSAHAGGYAHAGAYAQASGCAKPVAANEHGSITGDPHFKGGDGGKFDVQGQAGKTYDLLTDSNLQLRGRFDAFGGKGATVVGESGLNVSGKGGKSSYVNFRKDGTASINGQQIQEGREYRLADGGTAKLNGKTLTTTTGEGYTVKQEIKGNGNKAYINMDVHTGAKGVGNGKMPGGLLGQTFDADNKARNGKTGAGAQGEGAIDGKVQDYERNSLKAGPANGFTSWTKGGSGDDEIALNSAGNHFVNGGSGDDTIRVNFRGNNDSATIEGGSGDDTVLLSGAMLDYIMNSQGGFNIFTDQDNNSIRIADDVENVRYKD